MWLTDGTRDDGGGERSVGSCCISAVEDNCINWGNFSVGGGVDSDSDGSEVDNSGVDVGRGDGENWGVFSSCEQEIYSWKTET